MKSGRKHRDWQMCIRDRYYVKELKAPAGFVSSDEVLNLDASYQGQDVKTVKLKTVKKNQPTTVEITK